MKAAISGVLFSLLIFSQSSLSQWVQTNGPNAFTGTINCITSNNNYLFINLVDFGVYRSTDGGTSWNPANSGLNTYVNVLSNFNGYLCAGTPVGFYISSNNGDNWYAPSNSGLTDPYIYAIECLHDTVCVGTNTGIFLTADNGSNWQHVFSTSAAIFCFTKDVTQNNGTWLYAGAGSGIIVSTNSGINWTPLPYGIPTLAIAAYQQYIFSGAGNGIYLSTNYGQNWSSAPVTSYTAQSMLENGNLIYCCGVQGIHYTTDFGSSWNSAFQGATIEAMLINESYTYACSYQKGMFRSSNGGANWENSSFGLQPYADRGLAIIGETVFGGTEGAGVYSTQNNGEVWNAINNGLVNLGIVDVKTAGSRLYVLCSNGLYTSTDLGLDWIPTGWLGQNIGAVNNYVFGWTSSYYDKPSGIYVSSDYGFTWQLKLFDYNHAYAFFVDGNNIYAGYGSNIKLSTDNGDSWTDIGGGVGPNISFLVHNGYAFTGTQSNGVYRRLPRQNPWTQSNTGLTDLTIHSLCAVGSVILAGTDHSVFESTNEGLSWGILFTGIPYNTQINSLAANSTNVFAATSDKRIWRIPVSSIVTAVENHNSNAPDKFSLSQNYPNPFNPSTKIKFDIPAKGNNINVRLVVYDVLGREVGVLINKELKPGSYEYDWNGSNYPSGVYFYKLTAGDFTKVKKMILLK